MSDNEQKFSLEMPFWIDTDAYSDRDRLMFCCGVEFEMLRKQFQAGSPIKTTIHRDNESRVRMMAGRFHRSVRIVSCETDHDPDGTWSYCQSPVQQDG